MSKEKKEKKIPRVCIGIDPGITGKIVVLKDGEFNACTDVPVHETPWFFKKKTIDVDELNNYLWMLTSGDEMATAVITVEKQFPRSKQSIIGISTLMINFGMIMTVINNALPSNRVLVPHCRTWQKEFNWNHKSWENMSSKQKSLQIASELYDRKFTDHNESDAALIAWYGHMKTKDKTDKELMGE